MIKFKPVYKSDYSKIAEDANEKSLRDSTVVKSSGNSYLFKSNVTNSNSSSNPYTVVSNRSRNENDRFKNRLVTKNE
jgi:hypothetical protein